MPIVVPFALLQACLALGDALVNFQLRRRGAHTEVAIVSQRGDIAIKITQ